MQQKINIKGIVSCSPSRIERNIDLPFDQSVMKRLIDNSGIETRRIADSGVTTSDLCQKATEYALDRLKIKKEDCSVLVFVTQYPDYISPSTAHILQHKLDLPKDTICIQINEGCAGYMYGLQMACLLLNKLNKGYGLLLAGDVTSCVIDKSDATTRPLFGDAGSVTVLEIGDDEVVIELGGDGSCYNDIIVKEGFRNNNIQSQPRLEMNGMNVFSFGISKVPKLINAFIEKYDFKKDSFDYIVLHQANKLMNERIVRKLDFQVEKALYSLKDYGNTSCASIPLTIVTQLKDKVYKSTQILACGFGVGMSWGTALLSLNPQCFLDYIEFEK